MDLSVTHVEQMQRIFFISTTAWYGGATCEFQIHINWKVKYAISDLFNFLNFRSYFLLRRRLHWGPIAHAL